MKPKQFTRKWPHDLIWLAGIEAAALLAVVLAIPFLVKRLSALKSDADAFEQTRAADLFSVTLEATAQAPLTQTFEIIVPIDLSSIMPGYGPLPAVSGVEAQTGDWNGVGQTRSVRLADESSAREETTLYDSPNRFGYTVSDWSGALKFLAREAKSEWRFSDAAGQTRVEWRYAFAPRSAWTAWLLLPVVQLLWRGTMKQALHECVRQAEKA